MPFPAIAGAALSFGANTLVNQLTYQQQRRDSLADWNRQNEYNSPSAQVQRLRDAGISPYTMSGNAVTASSGAPPISKTQMNPATDTASSLLAMQNYKNMQLQGDKLQAETDNVNADTRQKELNTSVDSNTLLPRRMNEIEQGLKNIQLTTTSIAEKQQQVQNMKATLEKTLVETSIQRTEDKYRDPILAGKTNLQNAQLKTMQLQMQQIRSQIQQLDIRNDQDVKRFPFELSQITERIQNLKNDNLKQSTELYYQPESLRQNQELKNLDIRNKKYDVDYKETIDPQLLRLMKAANLAKHLIKR